MDNILRVAVGTERMSCRNQFPGQFLKIVNFSIENHGDAAILVEQGLMSAGHIHDRKAAMTKTHPGLDVDLPLIRTPVYLSLIQSPDQQAVELPLAFRIK